MTYKVFLPYKKETRHNLADKAFHWLCWYNSENKFKGTFKFRQNVKGENGGSDVIFTEKEDMQLFILMWGEDLE